MGYLKLRSALVFVGLCLVCSQATAFDFGNDTFSKIVHSSAAASSVALKDVVPASKAEVEAVSKRVDDLYGMVLNLFQDLVRMQNNVQSITLMINTNGGASNAAGGNASGQTTTATGGTSNATGGTSTSTTGNQSTNVTNTAQGGMGNGGNGGNGGAGGSATAG